MRRVAGGAGLAVVLALAAAACGAPVESARQPPPTIAPTEAASPGLPSRSPAPAETATPAETAPPAETATPVTTPALDTLPPASVPPSPGAGDVVLDPSLLDVLPAEIAGSPVTEEREAFAEAASDPSFAANVEAAAFGLVVAGNDLALAVVARPVSGAWSEAWFRDWRDSYDEGACAQSGGVAGTAEAQLGGRTVYIGTCAGGLHTYHTWLEDRNVIVSLFSVGDGRYGEQVMRDLRP